MVENHLTSIQQKSLVVSYLNVDNNDKEKVEHVSTQLVCLCAQTARL